MPSASVLNTTASPAAALVASASTATGVGGIGISPFRHLSGATSSTPSLHTRSLGGVATGAAASSYGASYRGVSFPSVAAAAAGPSYAGGSYLQPAAQQGGRAAAVLMDPFSSLHTSLGSPSSSYSSVASLARKELLGGGGQRGSAAALNAITSTNRADALELVNRLEALVLANGDALAEAGALAPFARK